ncbi:MAG: DUF393 domain-containing protein, partial [Gemmatimonadetes bacterium]|nr:DUF393 domain-containing protein [Gemmatimonadota bacterium]
MPLLIFDGDCTFCRRWIARWQGLTGERTVYAPYQEAGAQYPEIPFKAFETSVQFITSEGNVFSGAEAVFQTLAYGAGKKWPLWLYQKIPGVAPVTEWFYGVVARHRGTFSKWTGLLWG